MALKMTSFAVLLPIGGDGGESGDIHCAAPVHAGLAVPTGKQVSSPPTGSSGEAGSAPNLGGDAQTEHPCGLPHLLPTDPTDPTKPGDRGPTDFPTDLAERRVLHAAYMAHHWTCMTCIAGGQGRGLRCGVGTTLLRAHCQ